MLLSGTASIHAQGFVPPSDSTSAVYFTRISSMGFAVNFKFFHNDVFIGKFKGKNYMRYECSSGEQLFWASSERKAFITADLEPGKIYIMIVVPEMGAMSAAVALYPPDYPKDRKKAIGLVMKKEPQYTDEAIIIEENNALKEYIAEQLKRYESKVSKGVSYPHISSDMFVQDEEMK